MLRVLLATILLASAAFAGEVAAQDVQQVRIALLRQLPERLPKLSNLELPPADEGLAGGELAVAEANITGRFTGQVFSLHTVSVPVGGDASRAFSVLAERGFQFVALDVPPDPLLEIAEAARGREILLFNVGAPDDRLREEDCRANVLHIPPSRAMLTDALAQYFARKRWLDWFLVTGRRERDRLYAAALRRSAKKFGARIVAERPWEYTADMRRTAQSEVPVFTQRVEYDVLIVADEIGEFGEYLAYRTWLPRPVAGTQGLTATSWHTTHEQWGATQLQNRFAERFGRRMTPLDYHVWAAVRAIAEAATRTSSATYEAINPYLRSDNFELAGFKGEKLTFRSWDLQLRQPILLAAPRSLVSVSPQEGFLHQFSLLDTLGIDRPESRCRLAD